MIGACSTSWLLNESDMIQKQTSQNSNDSSSRETVDRGVAVAEYAQSLYENAEEHFQATGEELLSPQGYSIRELGQVANPEQVAEMEAFAEAFGDPVAHIEAINNDPEIQAARAGNWQISAADRATAAALGGGDEIAQAIANNRCSGSTGTTGCSR